MRKTPKPLWTAAIAGLICGLAARHWKSSGNHAGGAAPAPAAERGSHSPPAAAGRASGAALETRLARYATQPPGPIPMDAPTARRELDQWLRMLLLPVSRASIQEGAAAINAAGGTAGQVFSLAAIFSRWAAEDPDAALAAVDILKVPEAKCSLTYEVFRRYGADSAAGALAKAGVVPGGMLRAAALSGISEAQPLDRVPEVLRTLAGSQPPHAGNNPHTGSLERALVKRWLKSDPQAALEFSAAQENPARRTALLKHGMKDLEMQMEMGQSPGIPPEALLKLAEDPRNQEGLREELGRRLGATGSTSGPAMEKILAALPTDADRRAVVHSAISLMLAGHQSPELLAGRFAAAGRMEEFEPALRSAALAGDFPGLAKAAQWTAQHSPTAWEGLVADASRVIPFATANWLATLPPGPERDRAVAIFARVHASSDPERAAAWAESITDPAQRGAVLNETPPFRNGKYLPSPAVRQR